MSGLETLLTVSLLVILAAIWLWFRCKHHRWVRVTAAIVGTLCALVFAGLFYVATHLYFGPSEP